MILWRQVVSRRNMRLSAMMQKKLLNIINDDKTVRVPKVTGHKDVKVKQILNFLGLRK